MPVSLPRGGPVPVQEIAQLYSTLRGPLVFQEDWKKTRGLAKQILKAGYSLEEIKGCMLWLHQHPKFKDWNWTVAFVGKMLPEYRRKERQEVARMRPLSEVQTDVPEDFK